MRFLLFSALFFWAQAKLDVAPKKLSMTPGDFHEENVKNIRLFNSNPNSHVAFKIHIYIHGLLNDRRFSVNPSRGIIIPGGIFLIQIRLHDGLPVSGSMKIFDQELIFPIELATIDYNFKHYRTDFTESIVEIEGKPHDEAISLLADLSYEYLGTAGNNEETSVRSHYGPNGAGAVSIYQTENLLSPMYHNYVLLDSSELPTNADGSINENEVTYDQFDRAQLYHGKGVGSRPHSHLKNARNELNDENTYPIHFNTQGDYNKPLIQRIKRIWASGHGIVIFRYTNDISEQEAFDREASVLELKGYQLYNIARGRNPTYWATVYGRNFNQFEFGARNIWQAYELFKKSRAFIQRKDGAKGY